MHFIPAAAFFLRHEPKQLVMVASVKHYLICGFHLARGNQCHASLGCKPCRATNIGAQSGLEDLDLKVKFVIAKPCTMDLHRVGLRQLHELILDIFDPFNLNSLANKLGDASPGKALLLDVPNKHVPSREASMAECNSRVTSSNKQVCAKKGAKKKF